MRGHTRWLPVLSLGTALLVSGCGPDDLEEALDPEEEGVFADGKLDNYGFGSCQTQAMLSFLNAEGTSVDALRGLKVSKSAATNIVAHRDGPDGEAGTADDDPFDDLVELDKVKYVGLAVMKRVSEAAPVVQACQAADVDVIFSPQPYASSHLSRIATLIDGAKSSLDVAMYNLSDSGAIAALGRAVQRGVKVRYINEEGALDAKAPAGTTSAKLEALGVNVRYVSRIMHHKFMIVDGPRDDAGKAASATLVSGSANWSNGGGTRYDENTLFLSKVPRLALRYQAEFHRLWQYSKDFVWDANLPYELGATIDPASIPADENADAAFTSDNFTNKPGSTTFYKIVGKNTVADVLVKAIQGAKTSIHIASGHLRSRPISEALLAAKAAKPSLDIKVYLDGQEYISAATHATQVKDLQTCLQQAGSNASAMQECKDKGFYFSYQVSQAGIALRFKYYAYRWDYNYAKQMHNKYMVVDGKTLITGSYNLSDNAEHNTFENMMVLTGAPYAALIQKYEQSFAGLWATDEGGAKLTALKDKIANAATIPLVFDAMALSWQQVTDLKALIVANCPKVNSAEYRNDPPAHTVCPR